MTRARRNDRFSFLGRRAAGVIAVFVAALLVAGSTLVRADPGTVLPGAGMDRQLSVLGPGHALAADAQPADLTSPRWPVVGRTAGVDGALAAALGLSLLAVTGSRRMRWV